MSCIAPARVGCFARALGALALLGLCGCAPLYPADPELAAPRSQQEWGSLVETVRELEREIGFKPTANFRRADGARAAYRLCGHGSPLYLPYSYQDPAIVWVKAQSEQECRASAGGAEVSFATTEAMAGRATPVTGKLLIAPLPRFQYVVLHEDCHEQFGFPSGIEEALCNALAYAAMERIARERFADRRDERDAIEGFARAGAARAAFTRELYDELEALYAKHRTALISPETLLYERGELFVTAEQRLDWPHGALNNIWLATAITYSRHYGTMQRVLDAFDGDLAHAVAFFRRIDAAKPDRSAFAAAHGLAADTSVEFVRRYEAAIVKRIERALPESTLFMVRRAHHER